MIRDCPIPLAVAKPPRAANPPSGAASAWKYQKLRGSKRRVALAAILSAVCHAGLLFGLSPRKQVAKPAEEPPVILLDITMTQLEDLDEPELLPGDEEPAPADASAFVPMQADVPQIALPSDFVQEIDYNSLVPKPDIDGKVFAIPENLRRGGKALAGFGPIFNLSDLDREPQAVVRPAPIYPPLLRREAISATVRVEFIVDAQGNVVNPVIVDSTHRGFDDAALAGVSKWKFKPGMRGGRKVNTRMAVPILFRTVEGE